MKKNLANLYLILVALVLFSFVSCDKETEKLPDDVVVDTKLSGSITDVLTLDAAQEYTLEGPLLVEDGAVLNIPAGTVIKARKGFGSYILVLQGGKINVKGTAEKPVRMEADKADAGQGYWGGLIINGKAPLAGGETGSTEINSAYSYGGDNVADNSGTIQYLVLANTGARSSANVEHNGLTLNGVGNGTVIENVFIPEGADDGIEFFGGSVNVTNLLVVNSDDDMFDITQGYSGTLANCYGIWESSYVSTEEDPRGVEADGNLDGLNPTQSGQSNFTIKNMTIDLRLSASGDDGKYMHDVLKVRRGAKAMIQNALVKGSGQAKDLVDMTDSKSNGNPDSQISINNALSAKLSGKELNGEAKLTLSPDSKGCDTSVFAWTGYKF